MVSVDHMLISTLSVEASDMLCAEAAEALALLAWDLNPDNLLSPLHQICDLRNPSLSCIQFCYFIISFMACPDLD